MGCGRSNNAPHTPKDAPVLVPAACECYLQGTDSAGMIKLRILREEAILDYVLGPKASVNVLSRQTRREISEEESHVTQAEGGRVTEPGPRWGAGWACEPREPAASVDEARTGSSQPPRPCRPRSLDPVMLMWTPSLWSCERMKFCCFQPPSRQEFGTATLGH